MKKISYRNAIREALLYKLKKDKNFNILGQGVTSPWYVGGSLHGLNNDYPDRIIEAPVSESLVTAVGFGASMHKLNCLVIHPRMDFMLYAMDNIINHISKWNYIFGGEIESSITIRSIINRGGSQGAQHSQSLHSLFAHIPGLYVVMPSNPSDAYNLLVASINSPNPVLYIDDRWIYDEEEEFHKDNNLNITDVRPRIIKKGKDITLVSSSYSTLIAKKAISKLNKIGIFPELIDLRVINPFYSDLIVKSVNKTGRLLAIDGSNENCGLANHILGATLSKIKLDKLKSNPQIITLPSSPAPSSAVLENYYYPNEENIEKKVIQMLDG